MSYYSIHDFTGLEDLRIMDGEGSTLTLNAYSKNLELIYNSGLFSDLYIEHMAANICHFINEAIESPNHILSKSIFYLTGKNH